MVKKKTTTLYVKIAINSFTMSEEGCDLDANVDVDVDVVGVGAVVGFIRLDDSWTVVVTDGGGGGGNIGSGSDGQCFFPNKSTILSVSSLDISNSSIGSL